MQKYQVQIQAVLVGSKESGESPTATQAEVVAAITSLLSGLQERTFSTGSHGFYVAGKVVV